MALKVLLLPSSWCGAATSACGRLLPTSRLRSERTFYQQIFGLVFKTSTGRGERFRRITQKARLHTFIFSLLGEDIVHLLREITSRVHCSFRSLKLSACPVAAGPVVLRCNRMGCVALLRQRRENEPPLVKTPSKTTVFGRSALRSPLYAFFSFQQVKGRLD